MTGMEYIRNCPDCNRVITYGSKYTMLGAEKKGSRCKPCALSGANNGMTGRSGDQNPFFGKKHTEQTKQQLREKDKSYMKADAFAQRVREGMQGKDLSRDIKAIWIKKYGRDGAKKRENAWRERIGIKSRGKNNPMYGKPTPVGSGRGISGWYDGLYFRSLRELHYIIDHLEPSGLVWVTGESHLYNIEYTKYDGTARTYRPDFVVGNKMIEIKPKRLWNTPLITLKREAAEKFCVEKGLTYELVDVGPLPCNRLEALIEQGRVRLTDKSKEWLDEWKIRNAA